MRLEIKLQNIFKVTVTYTISSIYETSLLTLPETKENKITVSGIKTLRNNNKFDVLSRFDICCSF